MLRDSNFFILIVGVSLTPSIANAWWPFGDLGSTGFFNGFNNAPAQTNYIPVQQQSQPQQQQPYLQAIPMQQVPVQQQTHRAQPQNQAWWPFGNMPANDNNFIAPVQAVAPTTSIDWETVDPNTDNTTERWVKGPNGRWQLVRETIKKQDNGNGSQIQGYHVSSVFTSDNASPDMLHKVLPQVDAMSNRFGIPINVDPTWSQVQPSQAPQRPPPRILPQDGTPLPQRAPMLVAKPMEPQEPVVVRVIERSPTWQPAQPPAPPQRVVPIYSGYRQEPVEVQPVRVVPIDIGLPSDRIGRPPTRVVPPPAGAGYDTSGYVRPVLISFQPLDEE